MVATPHMLAGAGGARNARSTPGAVAIGALTHLALDAVPHRDYRIEKLGGLVFASDAIVGTLAVCLLSRRSKTALWGALGGVLPDLVRSVERALDVNLTRWAHDTIHTPSRPAPWRSALVQGLVAGAATLVLAWNLDEAVPDEAGEPAVCGREDV